jgi:hypothetical protein
VSDDLEVKLSRDEWVEVVDCLGDVAEEYRGRESARALEVVRQRIWSQLVDQADMRGDPREGGLSIHGMPTHDDSTSDEPRCACGHLISVHQTGVGPWTGFCAGDPDVGAIAYLHGVSEVRLRLLLECPRNEDGVPSLDMTMQEWFAVQEADDLEGEDAPRDECDCEGVSPFTVVSALGAQES